jgi:hypothetical protein
VVKKIFLNNAQTSASSAVKKKGNLRYTFIIIIIFSSLFVNAQSEKLPETITEIAEGLAADETDTEAVASYTDRLHELVDDPVNVNSSNENELSKLFFLSDFQIKSLLDYTRSKGYIVSVYEIANIPGFDRETAMMILPFIKLGKASQKNNQDSSRLRHQLITNISFKPGNRDTSSLGSPMKILTKYRFTTGNIIGGLTMEKDAGEKFLTGTPPLPDFLSGYISYKGNGILKKLIAGDFSARFGQGTNINTGIRRGISLVAPGYMSASDDIKPYTSTDESRFLRGITTQLSVKNFDLFLFYSKNYSDATLSSYSGISNDYFETFYTGGVHNTILLQNKKDAVSEIVYGSALSCNFNNFKSGFTFSRTFLSLPKSHPENDPLAVYDFQGLKSSLLTVYYNLFVKRILLFGELSANDNKNFAIIQGMSLRPSDRLTINALFRKYGSGFTSFYGQGPGTGSKSSNQIGATANFTFEAAKHLFVSGGSEFIYYPWLRFRCSSPSWGARREVLVKFLPGEKLSFDASYNYILSIYDDDGDQGIRQQEKIKSRSIKTSIHYSPTNNITLGIRMDYKFVSPSGSKGFLLCQDLNYSFTELPVALWFRYCLFSTDDWNSRIYTYENDLLYSFSIPALSGEGSRSYVMIKWKLANYVELRVKYGITSIISSGNSKETDEFKMQFKLKF